jgi:hypothetical protein
MKRALVISLLALALGGLFASPAAAWNTHSAFHHHGVPPRPFFPHPHGRVFIAPAPFFWGPAYWGPGWGYSYPAFYSYPYSYPYAYPSMFGEFYSPSYLAPPVYQQPSSGSEARYWYYCPSAREYYPKVLTCPEPWLEVPPTPQQ